MDWVELPLAYDVGGRLDRDLLATRLLRVDGNGLARDD